MKCDVCSKDFLRGQIRKLNRKEVIQKLKIVSAFKNMFGIFGNTKTSENWRKPEYTNIDINNKNYARLTRICKTCLSTVV